MEGLVGTATACSWAARPSIAVEAIEWRGDSADLPSAWVESGALTTAGNGAVLVHSVVGLQVAGVGDFLLHGVGGDFYTLDAATFHQEYRQERAE